MKCGDFTLLFAVDHFATKEAYVKAFTEEGYRVLTCNSAEEVLFALKLTKIDLLVTDLKLPQTDSVDIIPVVNEKCPGLPVVVVSAYHEQLKERYLDKVHSVQLFLGKPIQMASLKTQIRQILKIV